MKRREAMEEVEQSIADNVERAQVLEGQRGFTLSSTQLSLSLALSCAHAFVGYLPCII